MPPTSKKTNPPPSNTRPSPAKRPRGAPRGNKNARKHGFYSASFRGFRASQLEQAPRVGLQNEIELLRVMFDRLVRQINARSSKGWTLGESLYALHTLTMTISRLNSMIHTQRALFPKGDDKAARWAQEHGIDLDELSRELDGDPTDPAAAGPATPFSVGRFGNKNALKHGFYADLFTPDELHRLETLQGMTIHDQVVILREIIKQTIHSFRSKDFAHASLAEKSRALRVVSYAGACLERLERTAGMAASADSLIHRMLLEVLKEVNPPKEDS